MAAVAAAPDTTTNKRDEAAPADKKRKKHTESHVYYAADLATTYNRLVFGGAPEKGKHDNKFVSLKPSEGDTAHRTLVVVEGGGYIPSKFGVERSNQYGKTYLSFPVTDPAEQAGLRALDQHTLALARTDAWWPERAERNGRKAPGDDSLEEGFRPILKAAKPKKNGDGFYTPLVKVEVPVAENGDLAKGVKVVDHNNKPVSIYKLNGRKFARVVFELHFVFFKQLELGICKKLHFIKLAPDSGDVSFEDDEAEGADMGYLDDPVPPPAPAGAPAAPVGPTPVVNAPLVTTPAKEEADLLALLGEGPPAADDGGHKKKRRTN